MASGNADQNAWLFKKNAYGEGRGFTQSWEHHPLLFPLFPPAPLTALKVPLSFLPLAVFLGLLRLFFLIGYLMELSYSISSDGTHRPVTDKYRVMGKYELGPDCTHPHIPYTHHTYTYHTYTYIPHTQTHTIYTNTHRKCLFPFSFVSWIK